MQGFILKIQRVRDEDCLVYLITKDRLIKSYRFYGVRHSIITQGFKLDFELKDAGVFLPHLRSAMHLGFSWLLDTNRLLTWQNFMRLMYEHLKDTESIDSFYYDLLEDSAIKFAKQNPKRVIVESYIKILDFEGRLHNDCVCFLCDQKIKDRVSLTRGFLLGHQECLQSSTFDIMDIKKLFSDKKTMHLSDEEIMRLYYIILDGL